ncbi:MAG: cell division protein ZapA [Chlorobiales bacterium]|nr:cell division protein ZapA [Chlorobiales bacterium]
MQSLKVKVLGDEYPLLVDNKDLTEAAAHQVEDLIKSFKTKAPELNQQKQAILAAIHIAEKNKHCENNLAEVLTDLDRLNTRIELLLKST